MKIKRILAREILDSRGWPTIEALVNLENGISARAAVPSGASTGAHEALELRDNDPKRYAGKGVLKAVKNVNTKIAALLVGENVLNQERLDGMMLALDGTPNKSKLGANAILAVSMALARAGAQVKKQPLYEYIRKTYKLSEKGYKFPSPTMNIINGGRHADNSLTIQEFMVIPKAATVAKRVQIGAEVFYALKELLKSAG